MKEDKGRLLCRLVPSLAHTDPPQHFLISQVDRWAASEERAERNKAGPYFTRPSAATHLDRRGQQRIEPTCSEWPLGRADQWRSSALRAQVIAYWTVASSAQTKGEVRLRTLSGQWPVVTSLHLLAPLGAQFRSGQQTNGALCVCAIVAPNALHLC